MSTPSPAAVAAALARMAQRLPQDGSIDAGEVAALGSAVAMLTAIDRHRDALRALIACAMSIAEAAPGGPDSVDVVPHADVLANANVRELLARFPDARILGIAPIPPIAPPPAADAEAAS